MPVHQHTNAPMRIARVKVHNNYPHNVLKLKDLPRGTEIIMCRINKKLYLPETSEEVGASISTIKRDTIIALKRISSYKRFCLQNTMN